MDDISRVLSSGSSHSSSILQVISNLYTKIKTGDDTEREAGVKLVWSGLGSEHVLVSRACADLITSMVRTGAMDTGGTVTQLLGCLGQGMVTTGIVPALGQVLCHQAHCVMSGNGGQYPEHPYLISSAQHPFISVLRSTPAAWSLVLDQCHNILHHRDHIIRRNALAMLKPVLLYLFCDPNHHLHFGAMRSILLDTLLTLAQQDSKVLTFTLDMLDWIKLDNRNSLPETSIYILKLFDWCLVRQKYDLVTRLGYILPSLAFYQAKHGLSVDRTVNVLDTLLRLCKDCDEVRMDWDVVMVVVQQVLTNQNFI